VTHDKPVKQESHRPARFEQAIFVVDFDQLEAGARER
jgi:hypothetical protein